MNVYELTSNNSDPKFEGFADAPGQSSILGRNDPLDDFFPIDGHTNRNWKQESLINKWRPLKVVGRVRPFNDFPCLVTIPAFSFRAIECLRQLLEPNGEILELDFMYKYYAFHCMKIADVIDPIKSVAYGNVPVSVGCIITHFAFHEHLIRGLSIFKIPEMCNFTFVTQAFVDEVKRHGLNGFDFRKVWPYPQGTDYFAEHVKELRSRGNKVNTLDGPREVRAESLRLIFLPHDAKFSKEERASIRQFEDELDAQLFTEQIDDFYFGSLEGRKSRIKAIELWLSCPDARRLYEKLKPWWDNLEWNGARKAELRFGPFDDESAVVELLE